MPYNRIMEDSVFTMILNGKIPGEVVYQDDECFVLLTVQPFTEGHMLVVPKAQVDSLWDLPDDTYQHLLAVVKQMQAKLKSAYPSYKRIGMLVEGFGVPHAHVHVFGYDEPLEPTIEHHVAWKATLENGMIGADELKAPAEKLRAA